MKKYRLLPLLLGLAALPAQSAEETYPAEPLAGAEIVPGVCCAPQLTVTDGAFPAPFVSSWTDAIRFQQSEGRVILKIDHNSLQIPTETFPITVELELTRTRADGSRDTTTGKSLSVEYDPQRLAGDSFIDVVVHRVEDAHVLGVRVERILDGDGNELPRAPVNVVLGAEIVLTRYYRLDAAAPQISHQALAAELELSWTAVPGAEEYHLEWLHVNDYRRQLAELDYDFRFNSTRISTAETSYRISLIFEQGYVLYRVRGVGRGGADFDRPVYGRWSGGAQRGWAIDFADKFRVAEGHESDAVNWQHITNFAEGGKKKESVSYFDGSLRNRQVVSKLNTENEAIAGETIYDSSGRAAIQVLPTPTADPTLQFYRAYNRDLGDPIPGGGFKIWAYGPDDFDSEEACGVAAEQMNEASGSSRYYSSQNPDLEGMNAYIPHAGGYPFTHIAFTADNTGRIFSQGGVGPVHQLNSGRETRYFYGKPTQEHLDRLFGSEVGYRSHYKKNMLIDANGQASVSYLDQQGRVIATALAGESPDNLVSLEHAAEELRVDVLDNVPRKGAAGRLDSSFHHLVARPGEHRFEYSVSGEKFQPEGCPLCFQCVYGLGATVIDGCGRLPDRPEAFVPFFQTVGEVAVAESCGGGVASAELAFAADFGIGKYNVHKSLSVDQAALDAYAEAFFDDARCTRTLKDFIDEELALADFSSCDPATDCRTICRRELGEPVETAVFDACVDECERTDSCSGMRQILLGDVTPGGQYATFDVDPAGNYTAPDDSVLNTSDDRQGRHYKNPDLDYEPAEVSLPGDRVVTPQELELHELVRYWQPTWAEALLRYHPERCFLDTCGANAAADNYASAMREIETFEEALEQGYFNPLGLKVAALPDDQSLPPDLDADLATAAYPANVDPLFPPDDVDMRDYLTFYPVPDPEDPVDFLESDVWGLALAATSCASETTAAGLETCIASFRFDLDADPCTRDKLWQMFRALYLAKRDEIKDRRLTDASCPPGFISDDKEPRVVSIGSSFEAQEAFGRDFPDPGSFDDDPRGVTAGALGVVGPALAQSCPDNCEQSSGYWLVELEGCEALSDDWKQDRKRLEKQLVEVCRAGCAEGSPNGQGAVPDGHPGTSEGYRDFVEVVEGVMDGETLTCNGDLISSPFAYAADPASLRSGGNLDTCACDRILETRLGYQDALAEETLPAGVETLADYFAFNFGFKLVGLGAKLCACDDTFVATHPDGETWTPDAEWGEEAAKALGATGEGVPAELGCVSCTRCAELREEVADFEQTVAERFKPPDDEEPRPRTDQEEANYQDMLAHHLNRTLGLDLTAFDYQDFLARCDVGEGELTCDELTPAARDLEAVLFKLSFQNDLTGTPCLCQGRYRGRYVDNLAGIVDPSFPWGDPDADCCHTWNFTGVEDRRLTAVISNDGAGEGCEVSLEFVEDGFDFDRLVSFEKGTLRVDPADSGTNTAFLIDAVVAADGELVTTTLRGESCFPIAVCTDDPEELELCNHREEVRVDGPDDLCETQLVHRARTNAQRSYEDYVREQRENFRQRYLAQCLDGADETFTMDYKDEEYHYTLYYYDQAGNLARTVPPEGIETLPIELLDEVKADRERGERNVFTTHRMATTYTYNSLNQLVTQDLPDHDAMERWDFEAVAVEPGDLGPGEHLRGAGFSGVHEGYVLADDPEGAEEGTVYVTGNGGVSWSRVNHLGLMDLATIQAVDADHLFIAGGGGSLLLNEQGTWSLQAVGAETDLAAVHFFDPDVGLAFARDGRVYRSDDGGREWADHADLGADLEELTAAHFSSPGRGYAAGWKSAGGERVGVLLTTDDGGQSWSPATVGTDPLASVAGAGGTVFAAGADGRLLRASGPGPPSWTSRKAAHRRAGEVDAVRDLTSVSLFDAEHGLVGGRGGFLRYTENGGATWADVPAGAAADVVRVDLAGAAAGFALLADGTVLGAEDVTVGWQELDPGLDAVRAIDGLEADLLYAGGELAGGPAVRRFNGNAWSPVGSFLPTVTGPVMDLHLDTAGANGSALVGGELFVRRSGGAWASPSVAPAGTVVDFYFLPGTAVGYSVSDSGQLARTSDFGDSWSPVGNDLPAGVVVADLYVESAGGPAYAVAGDGDLYWTPEIEITAWALRTQNVPPPVLTAVRVVGSDEAYVAGADGTLLRTVNATEWDSVTTGHANDFHALDLSATGSGLVAGADGLILRASGLPSAAWNQAPVPPGVNVTLRGIDVETGVGYAVGGPVLLRTSDDGVSWSAVTTSAGEELNAVAVLSAGRALVAGDRGLLLNEAEQQVVGDFRTETLLATHNLGNRAWAVGADGAILHSSDGGRRWLPQASGTHVDLHGVFFTSPNRGFAVGDGGTILDTGDGGSSWRALGHGITDDLRDVHFGTGAGFGTPNPATGVVVGLGGKIFETTNDGTAWGLVTSGTDKDLAAVHMINEVGYAVGVEGTIVKRVRVFEPVEGWEWQLLEPDPESEPGTDWVSWVTNDATRDLEDVYFQDYQTGYVLAKRGSQGEPGLLLKTIYGGLYWTVEDTGEVANGFNDMVFHGEHQAFLSGSDGTGFRLEDLKDRFSTRFYYDKLGRLVASQNSKQFAHGLKPDSGGKAHFSYTKYDALGRIVEVGQLSAEEEPTEEILNSTDAGFSTDPDDKDVGFPNNWSQDREQVTITFYSDPMSAGIDSQFGVRGQENLRNRVASAVIFDGEFDPDDPIFDPLPRYSHGTHFNYDIHGNVKTLIQENRLLAKDFPSQRFKRIDYEYDLVSGNVNEVMYQEDELDAFYHRYEYDADNRIVSVETSKEKVIWDQDATYEYYKHGPLGRMELGEAKVQGVDYAYTIQGWIKGVNSDGLNPDRDIGRDGTSGRGHELVARDAYGFSLDYFVDDYRPIGPQAGDFLLDKGPGFLDEREDLFNGNIGGMLTSLTKPDGSLLDVQGGAFRYDQLNRLVRAHYFQSLDQDNFSLAMSSGNYNLPGISYDGNGNVAQLERRGVGDFRLMDNLTYRYFEVAGHKKNNRLLHVNDTHVTSIFEADMEDQDESLNAFEQRANHTWNYRYDELGNLRRDKQEEIENIEWTVYGKITRVSRFDGSESNDVEFHYDAGGNRTTKINKPSGTTAGNGGMDRQNEWRTTHYVHDASGNIMSIYISKPSNSQVSSRTLRLDEQPIYGSSRLGVANRSFDLNVLPVGESKLVGAANERQYELANHLTSVLATVSDQKTLSSANEINYRVDVNGSYDYYPFGSLMPARSIATGSYRYGFGGKEKDEEEANNWSVYNFGDRIFNPKLARWLTPDPLAAKYPELSPFNFVANMPLIAVDSNGREIIIKYKEGGETKRFRYVPGEEYDGDNEFIQQTITALNGLRDVDALNVIDELSDSEKSIIIKEIYNPNNKFKGKTVRWNPSLGISLLERAVGNGKVKRSEEFVPTGGRRSSALILYHELGHAYIKFLMEKQVKRNLTLWEGDPDYTDYEEKWIIENLENAAALLLGEELRLNHEGDAYVVRGGVFSTEEDEGRAWWEKRRELKKEARAEKRAARAEERSEKKSKVGRRGATKSRPKFE